jgi:L-iditol 2-dehydrogenase
MYSGPFVKTSPNFSIPDQMKAWVLGDPGELKLTHKPVPVPKRAEVLVRIDAIAICATDLEIIEHGSPALILGGKPFNKNFTPGHEYMGTVVALGPGVDECAIGQRVSVEVHAGCGQPSEFSRTRTQSMSCGATSRSGLCTPGSKRTGRTLAKEWWNY